MAIFNMQKERETRESNATIELADHYGLLKDEIKMLTIKKDRIQAQLIGTGKPEIQGRIYLVKIKSLVSKSVNWIKIANDVGISKQRIVSNTKLKDYDRVTYSHTD